MKIRTDFVTNSSSSSFIIAKKESLTEEQKETIIKNIEKYIFGKVIARNKEELDTYFLDFYSRDYRNFQKGMENEKPYIDYYTTNKYLECLNALDSGLILYSDTVDFEYPFEHSDFLKDVWKSLEDIKDNNFKGIDTDLDF